MRATASRSQHIHGLVQCVERLGHLSGTEMEEGRAVPQGGHGHGVTVTVRRPCRRRGRFHRRPVAREPMGHRLEGEAHRQ